MAWRSLLIREAWIEIGWRCASPFPHTEHKSPHAKEPHPRVRLFCSLQRKIDQSAILKTGRRSYPLLAAIENTTVRAALSTSTLTLSVPTVICFEASGRPASTSAQTAANHLLNANAL